MEQVRVMFLRVWKASIGTPIMKLLTFVCGIKERFDQPGYKLYSNLEALLVKAAKKENYNEELQCVLISIRMAAWSSVKQYPK